jgi:7-cyano-7-deazaguanine synthase in queuosine biosynthesis
VYVVDRLVKRRPKSSSRTIGLKIGVLDDGLWNQQDVRDCVHDALDFVTGDFWEIEFERDAQEYQWPERFLPFSKTDGSPLIFLYSSGLDSAAGLVARMNENPCHPVIPVTVWHQPGQRRLVHRQYKFLHDYYRSKGFGTQIDPLIVKVAMMWPSAAEEKQQERSQRSRSFLFTALGAITAIMHGQRTIEMFESGVGAINLSLMAGSKATRSSHPKFLRLMSKLASLVGANEVEFTLPFMGNTKGELVKSLAGVDLQVFAASTASCIHYPIRHKKYKQCGVCPACIFRRAALRAGGIQEPENAYKYDFLGPAERINHLPEKRLVYLKAFLIQVAQLRDIENIDRLPPAFEQHVVPHIVPKGQSQKGVIQLLARYRDEWMNIALEGQAKGFKWAQLLAAHRPETQGVCHASV